MAKNSKAEDETSGVKISCAVKANEQTVRACKIASIVLLLAFVNGGAARGADDERTGKNEFQITGSEFYRRDNFDTGEIRVFLRNSGEKGLVVSGCEPAGRTVGQGEGEGKGSEKIEFVYFVQRPPILPGGQEGELVIKPAKSITGRQIIDCNITTETGTSEHASILIQQCPIWICNVAFSADFGTVYVYVENITQNQAQVWLVEAGGTRVVESDGTGLQKIPAAEKRVLAGRLSNRPARGEYVTVKAGWRQEGRENQSVRVVRAINELVLLPETGAGDAQLWLDSGKYFQQLMVCPEHAHGTHKEAAAKFLKSRQNLYLENPKVAAQMWVCRSGAPRAWYIFGALADVAVINPILCLSMEYETLPDKASYPQPFFWVATMAKKATEPTGYVACIDLEPEGEAKTYYSLPELSWLVHCAIACGAKGIIYRGQLPKEQFWLDGFAALNRNLKRLEGLLSIAEPADLAATDDKEHFARAMLCGENTILVMIFDGRYFSQRKRQRFVTEPVQRRITSVTVTVGIPEGRFVGNVRTDDGIYSDDWNCQNGKLQLRAQAAEPVTVYEVALGVAGAQERN